MPTNSCVRKPTLHFTFYTLHSYDPDASGVWAVNGVDLVTQFVGYSLTNHIHFTARPEAAPYHFTATMAALHNFRRAARFVRFVKHGYTGIWYNR